MLLYYNTIEWLQKSTHGRIIMQMRTEMKLKKEKNLEDMFSNSRPSFVIFWWFFALLNKHHVRDTSIKRCKDYSGQISENSPKAHLGLCERNEHRTRTS